MSVSPADVSYPAAPVPTYKSPSTVASAEKVEFPVTLSVPATDAFPVTVAVPLATTVLPTFAAVLAKVNVVSVGTPVIVKSPLKSATSRIRTESPVSK